MFAVERASQRCRMMGAYCAAAERMVGIGGGGAEGLETAPRAVKKPSFTVSSFRMQR